MFGVSRNSVREAIKSLEQHGMLVSKPGAGTFIAASGKGNLASALEEAFARERHRLDDIFELRLLLEPQIAYLAAQRISLSELEALRKLIAEYEKNMQDGLPVFFLDQAFHDAIATATKNQSLMLLMEQMHDLLDESRDDALQSPTRNANSLRDHVKILSALSERDPDRARDAMCEHLAHTRAIVFTSTTGE